MGPLTGRAAGYCAGYSAPGCATAGARGGFGPGRGPGVGRGLAVGRGYWGGGGRGWRNMFYATGLPGWAGHGGYGVPPAYPGPYGEPDPEIQKEALKHRANALQAELDQVKKRLSDLDKDTE